MKLQGLLVKDNQRKLLVSRHLIKLITKVLRFQALLKNSIIIQGQVKSNIIVIA